MENSKRKFNNFAIVIIIIVALAVALMWTLSYTLSNPAISIKGGTGLDIYVSGPYVESDGDGYSVTKDSDITITAFNNTKIFQSYNITINDGITEKPLTSVVSGIDINKPIITFAVKTNYTLNINAVTTAVNPQEKGTAFSNAYLLRDHEECKALYEIFEADSNSNDENLTEYLQIFGFTNLSDAQDALQKAYIKVTTNILLDSEEFYGIGNERISFKGKIDFLNNAIYMNLRNSNYSSRFGSDKILNTGFFGIVEATNTEPVIIRNMNINGSVYFDGDSGRDKTLNTGTIAGLSTGNVIYQNITNSVSVSINDSCNINTGAGFGILSSPLQNWSNYVFTGKYVTIEAYTTGEGCNVNVGGLAAILSDTYCMDFKTDTINCTLSGNSAGDISGNCNVGGVFGLVRNTGVNNMIIDDIILQPQEDFRLISQINNTDATINKYSARSNNYAVVGGVIGNFENSNGKTISIGTMAYTSKDADNVSINIEALTSKENSKGNVYAGGLIGYIPLYNNAMKIEHFNLRNNDVVVFNADVDISATNNGYGEAFAGGLYGYNIPSSASIMQSSLRTITLSSENKKLNVLAIQESTAKSFDNSDLNTVAAGFITSVLPNNYTLSNLTINIDNGTLKAVRQIGAECLGPIYAGGFSGTAFGNNTSTVFIKNITLNYTNTEIAALGLSFDSISISSGNKNKYYNNLCVGSFIGYIENYGTNNVNTSNYTVSNNYGIENINVNVNNSQKYDNTFVKGTFNAKSGAMSGSTQTGMDNVTEAYVGGIIGHIRNTYMHNLNIIATNKQAFIEYSCDYDPDTAAVGGILGSTFLGANSGIDGGTVKNLYIRGKAHFNSANVPSGGPYDLYVGGAVGVGGFNKYKCVLKNIFVYNSEIRAVGENQMLTYSGGVVGGLWWDGTGIVYNCASIECEIIASSIKTDAFAGGIVALMQPTSNTKIISSYCINSNVAATSVEQTATAAGIVAQQKNTITSSVLEYCISTATVYASGGDNDKANIYPISPATINSSLISNTYNNYYDPYKVLNGDTDSDTLTTDKFTSAEYYTLLALYYKPKSRYEVSSAYNITNTSKTFTIYNNYSKYSNDNALLSVALSDNDVVTLLQNSNTCKPTGKTGVTYGLLKLKINSINEEYVICSYPIYYNSTNINYSIRPTTNNTDSINSFNYSNYVDDFKLNTNYNGKNDTYVKVQTGKHHDTENCPNYTEGIIIDFNGNDVPRFELHDANSVANSSDVFTEALDINNKIGQFTLSNNIIIEYNEHSITVIPREEISTRVILKIKFYDSNNYSDNVVLDFVPNYITDLDVYIAEDETPYLYKDDTDTNNPIYVFANTDVAVIEAKEIHNFPWLSDTNINFSLDSIVGGDNESRVTVNSNGMVKLDNVADGAVIKVKATYVGNLNANSNTISKTITLKISKEIAFETDLIGTKLTTTRKLVKSYPFVFTVTPLHGYGYSPTISIKIDGTSIFNREEIVLPEYTADVTDAVTLIEGCTYTYQHADGSYTFTFNQEFMDNEYSNIYLKVEFPAIYNLIFDSGPLIEKLNSSRYYIYQVKRGTIIDSALVENIINGINNSILLNIPYGFECKGFYLTERAETLSGYGDNFYELGNLESKWKVYTPLYFYARWTYEIVVDAPDMVEVESNFPLGLVEENSSSGFRIVPINALHGMEFSIKTSADFVGTPDFDMYVIKKNEDGTLTSNHITDKCILSEDKSYYYIDPFNIEGLLYLRIYPDNLAVNGIINENIDYIDKNILDNGEFYIKYSVNYTESGISLNDTVSNKVTDENGGINLNFSVASGYAITKGTTIRLYYHINKMPVGEYEYVASANSNDVYLKDFINTLTGTSIKENKYSYNGLVSSETYYFVVSYPLDSKNQYKPATGITTITAKSDINCNMVTQYIGSDSKQYSESVEFIDRPYEEVDNNYTIFNGAVLICTNTTESINITWTKNSWNQATNYRFQDYIFIWSIRKDGLLTDTEKTNFINQFGEPILITGNALYFAVNLEQSTDNSNVLTFSIDITNLSEYEISLSITRTPKTPASAIKLWSNI